MTVYLRNSLTYAWSFLVGITLFSWWLARARGGEYQLDMAITVGVLVMAAVKAWLVIAHFMEVRGGPAWLKRTTYGWVVGVLALLLAAYAFSH